MGMFVLCVPTARLDLPSLVLFVRWWHIYAMQHGWDRIRRLYTKKTANVQLKARNENLYAHACVERTASNLSVLGVEHTGDPGLSGHP